MATIQRPIKTYGTRKYADEVAAAPGNEDPILASEVDGDLETIYAAWNAGVDPVNIKPGAVDQSKIASGLTLWATSGTTGVTPITSTSQVVVPGPTAVADRAQLVLGSGTAKGRLAQLSGLDGWWFSWNAWFNGSVWTKDDTNKTAWIVSAGGTNLLATYSPTGAFSGSNVLTLDNTGNLTLAGSAPLQWGTGSVKARMTEPVTADFQWRINANAGGTTDNATQPSWALQVIPATDQMCIYRAPPAATASFVQLVKVDSVGNLTIAGATATKASGTTWANPSDRRLKDQIEDYVPGLDALLQLKPRTFLYNGKGGSTAGMRGYSFIADEVEPVMPEMVSTTRAKLNPDDEGDSDIQTLDTSNLTLALVNAVQELAARVTALEAR